MEDEANRIKEIIWENRVTRAGFLQSKDIINQAETTLINLTDTIYIKYDNVFWVKDFCLYDDIATKSFPESFKKAFEEKPDWPLKVIEYFNSIEPKVKNLVKKLESINWDAIAKKEKTSAFVEYVETLKSFQKYYVLAVPLTGYCEGILSKSFPQGIPKQFASPYQKLSIGEMHDSLNLIRKLESNEERDVSIKEHLSNFRWIKTAYNLIEPYTEEDVRRELELEQIPSKEEEEVEVEGDLKQFVIGLQVGIYIRNRMKELSQMVWYALEGLAQSLAKDLDVSRDAFLQLTDEEVLESLSLNKCTLSQEQLQDRQRGFAIGILDNQRVLITGEEVEKLHAYFSPKVPPNIINIKGTPASPGIAKGKARLILRQKDFALFQKGEVLVTTMTTPDFVILMRKAAAIITNEGGLSCHAAIVGRELGIPCVIGTKIATQALKDGDLVEVDANKGIVQKL